MLHLGHVALFKRLADYVEKDQRGGGKVVVAVQDNDFILKYKPESKIVYSLEEKIFMLESIRYIDEVVIYKDVDKDIQNIDFDILAVGPDQKHEGFQRAIEWCKINNKEVVVMPRTEGISSTLLKTQYINDKKSGSKITFEELKVIQMDILQAIDEFCEEHNIQYSLACGTLLGAVRHKGYIPWDDDIDIYLPREDYKRLINKIASLERDSQWERPYAKAYDDKTVLYEKVSMKRTVGVNIDIYPVDEVPDDEDVWTRYDKKRRLLQNLYWMKYVPASQGRSSIKRAAIYLFQKVTFFISKRACAEKLDVLAQKYDGHGYNRYFECCQGILQKRPFPKNLFEKLEYIPFEDRRFKAFSSSDTYLTNGYGDYMKLPPVEKRVSNHNIDVYWK